MEGEPVSDYDFRGFPCSLNDGELLNSWRWLRKYHMPLTVYLDQPPEWIASIDMLDGMLNVIKDDMLRKEKANHPNA